MSMDKFRVPDEEERKIIERNGINIQNLPMAVTHRSEDAIHLKVHKTGDEITIRQGYKRWDSY